MDTTQVIALGIAGFVLPYAHEKFLGGRVEGTMAIWVNFALCFGIAAIATIATGGFAGFHLNDPWAFAIALGGKASGTFALAQLVFKSTNIGKEPAAAPTP